MSSLTKIDKDIIDLLNGGDYLSGEHLASRLNISRQAVWKHIKTLKSQGLHIDSKHGKGYFLQEPVYYIDIDNIKRQLGRAHTERLNFHYFTTLDSTNTYVKNVISTEDAIDICLCEKQRQGRGRFGRAWHSPLMKNIYCSIRWTFLGDVSELSGLSLAVSLALCKALREIKEVNTFIGVKWPNDILAEGKKLAGTLIELVSESHGCTTVIIGIGLNVNMRQAELSNQWTSLALLSQCELNRNDIIALMLKRVLACILDYRTFKANTLKNEWEQYDVLNQQNITLKHFEKKISGKAVGIDENGHLLIQLPDGRRVSFASGEATLHKD